MQKVYGMHGLIYTPTAAVLQVCPSCLVCRVHVYDSDIARYSAAKHTCESGDGGGGRAFVIEFSQVLSGHDNWIIDVRNVIRRPPFLFILHLCT